MEENQNEQGKGSEPVKEEEDVIEDETVPIEQVNKVIAESGGSKEGYKDLSEIENPEEKAKETEAKAELEDVLIPENLEQKTENTEPSKEVPDIKPKETEEGQSGTDQLTNAPTQKETPAKAEGDLDRINLLQFECTDPNCQFKMYINLADDKLKELPEKVKCINCGKKKSIKKRVFDMSINKWAELDQQTKQPEALPEDSEEEEE